MGNWTWNQLIVDYLNNNQHKFDEHGNFDSTPDERDYWPLMLGGKRGKAPKPKGPKYAGRYPPFQGPEDVAKQRNLYAAQDLAKGILYDEEKCNDNWEFEQQLCKDGKYQPGCWDRARERYMNCRQKGHYDGLQIWTYDDEVDSPEELDKRKKKSGPNAQPNPDPEKKPDKSEFSLGSMFTNPLTSMLEAALVMNPILWATVDPDGVRSKTNQVLRNFVMLPEDYPEGLRPLSKWSPTPATSAAAGMLPVPLGGAATLRLAAPPLTR